LNPDLLFVIGLGIFALSVPIIINAFSSSDRSLRPAGLCIIIGGLMIAWAMAQTPGGYSIQDVPGIIGSLF
jgi:uncharacterized protein YjeT (DUF2065 family)